MKKRLCCFFFLMWYLAGGMIGYLGGRWYYPERQTVVEKEVEKKRVLVQREDGGQSEGGAEIGSQRLWIVYVGGSALAYWCLEIRQKSVILRIGWMILGVFYGIYLRGVLWSYPSWGIGYGLSVIVIPIVSSVMMGVYARQVEEKRKIVYRKGKRMRDMIGHLYVRLQPTLFYGAAMFVIYILDQEIIKRIQWYLLYQHIF